MAQAPDHNPLDLDLNRPKRWYDHDPVLAELLQLLELFQPELKEQATVFLRQVEAAIGPGALSQAYQAIEPYLIQRRRWYDGDAHLAKALELLKLLPPAQQRQLAMSFVAIIKEQATVGVGASKPTDA